MKSLKALKAELRELLSSMNHLNESTPPGEKKEEIKRAIKRINRLRRQLMKEDLADTHPGLEKAIQGISHAKKQAVTAQEDLTRTTEFLKTVSNTATFIDQIIQSIV